jgi:CheY-like chemotaxis protein
VATILVAEDDLHILRVISLWLERNGHAVAEARTGPDALERLRSGHIDLMVTDVNMPGMTGLDLLAIATAEDLLPRGAIVLTSRCDQQEIADAVRAQGGLVHPKPFSPSRLIATIEEKLSAPVTPAPL